MNPQTVQLLFFGAIIIVIVLLMFRNGRKRQRDQVALTQSLKPGAEVMTSFGLYGTVVSINEDENRIVLETSPGSHVTIHRQAVGRVVTPVAEDGTRVNGEPVVLDDAASDPAFGERADGTVDLGERDDAARGAGKNAD